MTASIARTVDPSPNFSKAVHEAASSAVTAAKVTAAVAAIHEEQQSRCALRDSTNKVFE